MEDFERRVLKRIDEILRSTGQVSLKKKEANKLVNRGFNLDRMDISVAIISLENKGRLKRRKGKIELI